MRAVVDTNVLVAGLLSPKGAPALVLREWLGGAFELVVSSKLLAELDRVLEYPKIARRIGTDHAAAFRGLLTEDATIVIDPDHSPPIRSRDPGDDYLIALAAAETAVIVTGDDDLLILAPRIPIYAPAPFLELLEGTESADPSD